MSSFTYYHSPDLETRYSALDALGNFFKTTSVNIIESSLIDKNANDSVDQKALHSQGEPTEIPTNTEREINSISAFLKRCLSILVNNLQYCESYILHAETFLEGILISVI